MPKEEKSLATPAQVAAIRTFVEQFGGVSQKDVVEAILGFAQSWDLYEGERQSAMDGLNEAVAMFRTVLRHGYV